MLITIVLFDGEPEGKINYIMHRKLYSMYTVQCTLYCTVYIVHYTLYIVGEYYRI